MVFLSAYRRIISRDLAYLLPMNFAYTRNSIHIIYVYQGIFCSICYLVLPYFFLIVLLFTATRITARSLLSLNFYICTYHFFYASLRHSIGGITCLRPVLNVDEVSSGSSRVWKIIGLQDIYVTCIGIHRIYFLQFAAKVSVAILISSLLKHALCFS